MAFTLSNKCISEKVNHSTPNIPTSSLENLYKSSLSSLNITVTRLQKKSNKIAKEKRQTENKSVPLFQDTEKKDFQHWALTWSQEHEEGKNQEGR